MSGGASEGAGGYCRGGTPWGRFLQQGLHCPVECNDGARGVGTGLLEGRRTSRVEQMVRSNQGRMSAEGGKMELGMELDLQDSLEGCSLDCSSLMGWVWLKNGCWGSELQGSRDG